MSDRKNIIDLVSETHAAGAQRSKACNLIGISVRTLQRWSKDLRDDARSQNKFQCTNALSEKERKEVIATVCLPEYRDLSPNQIVPILAEKGQYLASEATIYRLLKREGKQKHRSRAKAPQRSKPDELIATGPNQVWTWDISYLRTRNRGRYFYLYLILDIWDRSVVGWAIHESESGYLAAELLRETCIRNEVKSGSITVHQDNGAPMISSEYLSELRLWGRPSYSRPGVSDDNPYSESFFRTIKYSAGYPEVFDSLDQAEAWMTEFIAWYNNEHRHSGIGFVTPMQRRKGEDKTIIIKRIYTYTEARSKHPDRWSGSIRNWKIITEVALNPKKAKKCRQDKVV